MLLIVTNSNKNIIFKENEIRFLSDYQNKVCKFGILQELVEFLSKFGYLSYSASFLTSALLFIADL